MQQNQRFLFLAAFTGMVSVQTGAAFARTLFPAVGSEGMAALRLGISAIILMMMFRPWTLRKTVISWAH
ncbi:hypothetical protein [Mixta sp. Marseille-Q2659]|uniref:hypothetical protein n=1 Tax=Mixta sp. Marseille-Q2659 TaxID=2736607 RepID=UPI0023B96082|nr:hypothetical protein [Mixta sp. Marseille-Q2659]